VLFIIKRDAVFSVTEFFLLCSDSQSVLWLVPLADGGGGGGLRVNGLHRGGGRLGESALDTTDDDEEDVAEGREGCCMRWKVKSGGRWRWKWRWKGGRWGGGRPKGNKRSGFEVYEEAALVGKGLRFGFAHGGVVVASPRQEAAAKCEVEWQCAMLRWRGWLCVQQGWDKAHSCPTRLAAAAHAVVSIARAERD
jgi:hypothetical protein